VHMPGLNGVEAARSIARRAEVVFVTAYEQYAVTAFEQGALDYVVKPFDLGEVAARIRSALRRHAGRAEPQLEHRGIRLDPATRQVSQHGQPVQLSAREYAILEALLLRPGVALSRTQLEDRVYGWGDEVGSNAVEVHIHALRRKLGADAIRTLRGVGYVISKD